MGLLDHKVALVTGGAGEGMGSASSLRLAREGAAVVIADIDDRRGENLAAHIRAAGGNAMYRRCDVTEASELEAAVALAEEAFGGLDILHNHAIGPFTLAYLGELSIAQWDEGVRSVLSSAFYGIRAALPAMLRRGGGSIVITSSVAGYGGQRKMGLYSVSKAGTMILTQAVAHEYGHAKIRCNAIAPGMTGEARTRETLRLSAFDSRSKLLAQQALGRMVEPEEAAALVAFLASDQASGITGAVIPVDAGASAGHGDCLGLPPFGSHMPILEALEDRWSR